MPWNCSTPFCPAAMFKPQNVVFSLDDEIRRPALNFVTLSNYHGTMTILETVDVSAIIFLWYNDSLKLYELIDASHGPLGWLQWHL